MTHRYKQPVSPLNYLKIRPFSALREKFREGYTLIDFKSDLMAGIIVGVVALPLGMALAIACGVPPQHGIYTVIVGGGIVALLGGSRCQVTGPTAAFVVILAPIVTKFGISGLLLAGLLAGIILLMMGLARLGRLIQFIPYPVTTGFTTGIAVVIATIQLKDFFGLKLAHMPESYIDRLITIFQAKSTWSLTEFLVGASTLLLLLLWPKINKKVPSPLVVLALITVTTTLLKKYFPNLEISTIGNRFSSTVSGEVILGIPQAPPSFVLPWNFIDSNGHPFTLDFNTIRALLPSAFAIAMLGAIESLLSAVVADGMAQTRHDPDAELVGLGIGNILCPFFGGIAATGAIARTATNIRFGAKSPLAAMIHALFVLFVVLLFAPYVSYLPMAALSGLLILVAYNMSELKHFIHIVKVAPRSDVFVLLICFGLTVSFDMVIGVTTGIMLSSLLFMKKMASVTSFQPYGGERHKHAIEPLPKEVMLYEIDGPLFFGAAHLAVDAIGAITTDVKTVIFIMDSVPTIDVTGLVALETAINKLHSLGKSAILAGIRKQPAQVIENSGILNKGNNVWMCETIDAAVEKAKSLLNSK